MTKLITKVDSYGELNFLVLIEDSTLQVYIKCRRNYVIENKLNDEVNKI